MTNIRTENFTAKDIFNTATAKPLKDCINPKTGKGEITISAVYITERPDQDGNVQEVANFKLDNGDIVSTISQTVIKSACALPELLEDGDVTVEIEQRQGNHGRSFLVLVLK